MFFYSDIWMDEWIDVRQKDRLLLCSHDGVSLGMLGCCTVIGWVQRATEKRIWY